MTRETMQALAGRLADESGSILRHYFRTHSPALRKDDQSPVTHADREAESRMREIIVANFPDHGIYGEEHGRLHENAPYQWVLDPIDGTRSFIAGLPIFTTLIALVENAVPTLGVINQPITQERWIGTQNGTYLNGEKTQISTCRDVANATIATTSTAYFTQAQADDVARIQAIAANNLLGGDAYLYAMLASGHIDLVIDASLKPYDFCALVPVVEGAGGIITDWQGNAVTLHSDGNIIAAATCELHAQIMEVLHG